MAMRELLPFLLSCAVCGAMAGSAGDRECALFSVQGQHSKYSVSDGRELVTSTWDTAGGRLLSCSITREESQLRSFLAGCGTGGHRHTGHWGFPESRTACRYFLQQHGHPPHGAPHTRVRRGFTYPGTLWCGAGNNADTEEDLGEHSETDSCCRTHDHCEHVIHPFTYSYGYGNYAWHTISHCQCDNKFKECLRKVNDTASRVVGQAFFNVIRVQCFEFTNMVKCEERNWFGWCNKYVNMSVAVPQDSGLYDYGGNLIDKPALPNERGPTNPPPMEISPTLGQVLQATEDLLKIMMSVSPSTSPSQSKVNITTAEKKKDKTKKDKPKKERKHKKGKGLKGKRKNKSKKEKIAAAAKDIWSEDIVKNEEAMPESQPLDKLDMGPKQGDFNDILNDEPIRNSDANAPTPVLPTYKKEELKDTITSPPPVFGPCTRRPRRKDRLEQKERRHRKKKPNKQICGPSTT